MNHKEVHNNSVYIHIIDIPYNPKNKPEAYFRSKHIFLGLFLRGLIFGILRYVNNVNIHRIVLHLSVVYLRLVWVTIEMNIDDYPLLKLNITQVKLNRLWTLRILSGAGW